MCVARNKFFARIFLQVTGGGVCVEVVTVRKNDVANGARVPRNDWVPRPHAFVLFFISLGKPVYFRNGLNHFAELRCAFV